MTLTAQLMADIARWTVDVACLADDANSRRSAHLAAMDAYGVASPECRAAANAHRQAVHAMMTARAEREYVRERLARACDPWFQT